MWIHTHNIRGPFKTVRHGTWGGTYHQFKTSLHVVVTRANEKYLTPIGGKTPKSSRVSRATLKWRIIARIVFRNMPACRFNGVVHLILYLFAASVVSTLDLTVCDLWYGCSGVWMFVCASEPQYLNFDAQLGKVVDGLFRLAVSNRSAVVKVCHTSKGMALPEVSNMRPRLCATIVFVSDTMFLASDTHFSVRAAGTLRSGALRKSQNLDAKDRPNLRWCSEGQVVALGCRVWAE